MMKFFLTNNFFIHGVILVAGIIAAYLYLPMIALWFLGYSFYGTYKLWQKLFTHYKNKIVLFAGGLVLAATALIAAQFSGALFLGLSFVYHRDIKPRLITEVSPGGKNTAILSRQDNNNCYTVKMDEQIFYTKASIYHNTKWEWQGNDCFILKSSDVGDIEFRIENGVWKASPESLLRKKQFEPDIKCHSDHAE